MRVLVTGANGLVGVALTRALAVRGIAFHAAVRRASPLPARQGEPWHVVGNVDANTDWSGALGGVDVVVHLAARVHVMHERQHDPLTQYRTVNTAGTLNLARQAAAAHVRRFVFMSSAKVCGEGQLKPDMPPYTEMDPPAPADGYAISKLEAEQGLCELAASDTMELTILRPPLVYGPGVGANFLRLLEAVQRGWPLPLSGVKNRRSLIYVENLVDAVLSSLTHPRAANKTFLVSDGEAVSTPELIRCLAEALERPAHLFNVPPGLIRLGGTLCGKAKAVERLLGSLSLDSRAIRRELAWIPPFTLSQGLRETDCWYRTSRGI